MTGIDSDDWTVCDGSHVHALRKPWHLVCLICNIVIPGTGTILSAFGAIHERKGEYGAIAWGTLLDGLLQQALSVLIIGWVWSVLFGIALYRKRTAF